MKAQPIQFHQVSDRPIGTALCCGKVPEFGAHNLHVYDGKKMRGFGFYCPTCERSAAVTDTQNRSFCLHYWNLARMTREPQLDAPEGFKWGELRVRFNWMGGHREIEFKTVLFRNPALVLSEGLVKPFDDIEIINPANGQCLSHSFGKRCKGYVWLSSSRWTDGRTNYVLNMEVYPSAEGKIVDGLMAIGYEVNEFGRAVDGSHEPSRCWY